MQWIQNQYISQSDKETKVQFDGSLDEKGMPQFADAVKQQYQEQNQEQELLVDDND